MKQTYAVVIEWADGNYSGFAPDVPGFGERPAGGVALHRHDRGRRAYGPPAARR